MAAGLPVVDIPTAREQPVRYARTAAGPISPEPTPESIAHALLKLLRNEEEREILCTSAGLAFICANAKKSRPWVFAVHTGFRQTGWSTGRASIAERYRSPSTTTAGPDRTSLRPADGLYHAKRFSLSAAQPFPSAPRSSTPHERSRSIAV